MYNYVHVFCQCYFFFFQCGSRASCPTCYIHGVISGGPTRRGRTPLAHCMPNPKSVEDENRPCDLSHMHARGLATGARPIELTLGALPMLLSPLGNYKKLKEQTKILAVLQSTLNNINNLSFFSIFVHEAK